MKIAVVSDIHSNLEALESTLGAMAGIDSLWCLGDIVGYGSQPAECISRLRGLSMPLTVTAGNHDLGAAGSLTLETFNPEGRAAIEWTRPRLSDEQRRWLQKPSRLEVRPKTKGAASLLHASPRDPTWEYVTTPEIASECFTYFNAELCFFGHTHLPMIYAKKGDTPVYRFRPAAGAKIFLKELGDRWMVNPGSVGQPRDHDPRASFLIFEPGEMSVIWYRIEYQFEITAAKIRAAGLPPALA
ncbi:MAG: metallophosphoesterase family protein, partial [Actinomycetota bacterium]|nr:metallophosphoesterase family protein [Actinomycetota bacterium]